MILVDELQTWPLAKPPFRKGFCHLTVVNGTLDELHAFAARLGLRREWFQEHPIAHHYDLTPAKRERALKLGAVFRTAREQSRDRHAQHAQTPAQVARLADPLQVR